MEIYNFISESITGWNEVKELELIVKDLKGECIFVKLIDTNIKGIRIFTIFGQIYGDDTSEGDTTLISAFGDIKYTWVDAFNHSINNINNAHIPAKPKS